ncbi:alanine--tRNA ligase [Eubacteriales bacterium OttesenSCG-928-N14]|nr:alanine--tRNA ligase [Eubacteriales bacterium OttesenSCG-928-N14]
MKQLTSDQLRSSYLQFFKDRGHAIIPSASLIPENDPTVLFTTAGMHPLVPYLLGEKHPMGKRLADVQKCIRTGDIDEVGDASHLTFFEMLGNWSLGDYFKQQSITWSYEFLTGEEYLGIDPDELAVSVFEGDENSPRDMESFEIWRSLGIPEERIFFLGKEHNWWGPAGQSGPCGPDTEMFIIRHDQPCGSDCSPACGCGRYLEIWNNVFMQYNKLLDGSLVELEHPNVDTGMGLERTVTVLQGVESVYDSDIFAPIIGQIEQLCGKQYRADEATTRAMRIVADHIRAATFILGDPRGVTPSNVDQGYVLRRLIRRAVRFAMQLGMEAGSIEQVSSKMVEQYQHAYPELAEKKDFILAELAQEEERFAKTIVSGMKEFEKVVRQSPLLRAIAAARRADPEQKQIIAQLAELERSIALADAKSALIDNLEEMQQLIKSGAGDLSPLVSLYAKLRNSLMENLPEDAPARKKLQQFEQMILQLDPADASTVHDILEIAAARAFRLYDTFGFPFEMTAELAKERGLLVDEAGFTAMFEEHRKKSQAGASQRFAGGLADDSQKTTRLHTATHLLLSALRKVLGGDINQKGSNITPERLRFDFNFDRKLTPEELQQVEDLVNEAIAKDMPITCEEMSVEQAQQSGAIGVFGERYGQIVKVYTAGDFSKEICGGPHAERTGELGKFKIKKEESSSSGVRRIRAVLIDE